MATALALALLAPTIAGAANFDVCSAGTGAGQCERPEGLAVDNATGHLYVTDRGNRRIDVFDSEGHFLFAFGWKVNKSAPAEELQRCTEASGCQAGSAGSGAGQFTQIEVQAVAVDNDPTSPFFHAVYVFDRGNQRISRFDPEGHLLGSPSSFSNPGEGHCQFKDFKDPIAVGPGGTIYLGDTRYISPPIESAGFVGRVEKFNSTSFACEGESELFNGGPVAKVEGLAVDASGDLFAIIGGSIRKYEPTEPTATLVEAIDAGGSIGLDTAGHLWASRLEGRASGQGADYKAITEYEVATGKPLARFGYNQIEKGLAGLAPFPGSGGGTFASEESTRVRYLEAPSLPLGPIVPSSSVKASAVGNVQATLEAEANPEGKEATYHFEYLTQAAYEGNGDTFTGAEEVSGSLGSSNLFNVHYASATVGCPNPLSEAGHPGETAIEAGECLIPETEYRFRVVATNADNPEGTGEAREEGTFTTKAPLEIIEGFATEAGTESARLSAVIDPLGVPTTAHFELVTQEQFEASEFEEAIEVPEGSELSFGSGKGAVTKSAVVTGLKPGTTYRYRIIATDPLLVEPVAGEETYSLRPFALPTQATCPANEAFRIGAAAALPDCRAYEMVSPLDKEGGDIRPLEEGFIELPAVLEQASVPGPGEPQRLAYGSYRAFGDAVSAPWTSQYVASRTGDGWRSEDITPVRGRLNGLGGGDTELKLLSPDLCEAWWLAYGSPPLAPAAIAGQPNLYYRHGADCGLDHWEALTTLAPTFALVNLELQGAASNGAGALYVVTDSLPTEAPTPAPQPSGCSAIEPGQNCVPELYYQGAGEGPSRYVCVLPNGGAIPSGGCSAGTAARASGQFRQNTLAHALSADGSQVYWTRSDTGPGKLYLRLNPGQPQSAISGGQCTEPGLACTLAVSAEAEAEAGSSGSHYWTATPDGSLALFSTGGRLYEYDREAEEDTQIATGFTGLAGASKDASRIYFAANSVLAPANAQGEAPKAGATNLYLYDANRPEGERFSFVAQGDLAEYFSPVQAEPAFNTSRVSPDGSTFAFMTRRSPETAAYPRGYDNHDAVNGKAAAEIYLYDAAANSGEGSLICASCNPTGARPSGANLERKNKDLLVYWGAAHIPGWENSLYASRALSADGKRLYFESTDVLSPRDSNGASDVYQWQAVGSGSCKAGASDYFPSSGGCIDMISSGQSPSLSHFLDATPNGHDVFFSTTQSLDPQDPGLADVYDAREGGGFPSAPQPSPACEGEACQGAYEPPNDPTPASAAFQGAGNVKEEAKAKKKKTKKHKAKKRAKRRHANGKRRAR